MKFKFLIMILFFPLISYSLIFLDRHLQKIDALGDVAKEYIHLNGTVIDSRKLQKLMIHSKIYDSEHVFISGRFKSKKDFQNHIVNTLSWRLRRYSHYGYYSNQNLYLCILVKRYLDLKHVGWSNNSFFVISGMADHNVKNIMAYFQNLSGQVFHVLPTTRTGRFFEFKFSNEIEKTSSIFELIVETEHEGRRVASIIRKRDVKEDINLNFESQVDAEKYLLEKMNVERVSRGITPLVPDSRMSLVAREHSKKMIDKKRVFHSDLSLVGRRLNLYYDNIVENVGISKDINTIHSNFINSPVHFKNIVDESLTMVGIGVVYAKVANKTQIFATQIFYKPESEVHGGSLSRKVIIDFINKERAKRKVAPLKDDIKLQKELNAYLKRENSLKKITGYLSLTNLNLKRVAYKGLAPQSIFSIKSNPALYENDFTHMAISVPSESNKNAVILLAEYK